MVISWLVKVVLILAALGLTVIELGSPLVARAQADDAAHEVANEAAFAYGSGRSVEAMKERCAEVGTRKSVELVSCELVEGKVAVTVAKEAYSIVLHRISALESWYDVQVSATAEPR